MSIWRKGEADVRAVRRERVRKKNFISSVDF